MQRFAEERSRIAVCYLRELRRDFDFFYRTALLLVANSPADRGGLPLRLFRSKLEFECALLTVQVRLQCVPLWSSRVNLRRIAEAVQTVEQMSRICRLPIHATANF